MIRVFELLIWVNDSVTEWQKREAWGMQIHVQVLLTDVVNKHRQGQNTSKQVWHGQGTRIFLGLA